MSECRSQIIATFSEWTALSALRSGAPIKSRRDVYTVLRGVDFAPLFDLSRGPIDGAEFDTWHETAIIDMTMRERLLPVGWASKMVNVYLKTRVYVGGEGRPDLASQLHPPIDSGIWNGLSKRFSMRRDIVDETNCVRRIKDIDTYSCYRRIIRGCRMAAAELKCSLLEVEQLWEGTEVRP